MEIIHVVRGELMYPIPVPDAVIVAQGRAAIPGYAEKTLDALLAKNEAPTPVPVPPPPAPPTEDAAPTKKAKAAAADATPEA